MKDKWGFTEISALRLTIKLWGWLSHPDNPDPDEKEEAVKEVCGSKHPFMLHSCPCCEFARRKPAGINPECQVCPMRDWWGSRPSWQFRGRYHCENMLDSPYAAWMEGEEDEWLEHASDLYLLAKDALEWWLALREMNEM